MVVEENPARVAVGSGFRQHKLVMGEKNVDWTHTAVVFSTKGTAFFVGLMGSFLWIAAESKIQVAAETLQQVLSTKIVTTHIIISTIL